MSRSSTPRPRPAANRLAGITLWLVCALCVKLSAPLLAAAEEPVANSSTESTTIASTETDTTQEPSAPETTAPKESNEALAETETESEDQETSSDDADPAEELPEEEEEEEGAEKDTGVDESAAERASTPATNTATGTPGDGGEVETGDATAVFASDTNANTNTVDTTSTASTSDDSASTTDDLQLPTKQATGTANIDPRATSSGTTTISNTNAATTSLAATTSAETGSNNVTGAGGSITTGDAVAYANVVNVLNTNITDSQGLIDFINTTLGYEHFDLRDTFTLSFDDLATARSTNPCASDTCPSEGPTNYYIVNGNEASINTNVAVIARTGGNQATGTNATISTGNAYASANVVNLANTNITDSNYLLLVFNNFADYGGDVVLPNSDVFNRLFSGGGGAQGAIVDNENLADVENNVSVGADTGSNTTGSDGTIATGDASAQANVLNQINQNVTGGSEFSMLIRVHGQWSGDVFGLPEGMSWERTPLGVRLYQTGSQGGDPVGGTVKNTNRATINNDVSVYALTGENQIAGDNGSITTGNAIADANVLNIANTNVYGSNWASLIFNIYGNWSGNIAFGQPDLWLGLEASSPDTPIEAGSPVTYRYTILNRGDSPATDITIDTRFATGTLSHKTDDLPTSIDRLDPGETRELVFKASVNAGLVFSGETPLPLSARVESRETDANPDDNEDTVTIYAGVDRNDDDDKPSLRLTFPAKFDIEKTATHATASPGDVVDYTISLFNRGGQLYEALLVDILEDAEGNIVYEQTWPLDTIMNHEEITIEYSIELPENMATGTYRNTAQIVGGHRSMRPDFRYPYYSDIATHELVVAEPSGEVLGLQRGLPEPCPRYITSYLQRGAGNDPIEVAKLQTFLNEHQNAGLTVSGIFDGQTEVAVRAFQRAYAADILDPWGVTNDTGYVYYTTQKQINEIVCAGSRTFPLTLRQQAEINSFRGSLEQGTAPIDESQPIGRGPDAAGSGVASRQSEPDTPESDHSTQGTAKAPTAPVKDTATAGTPSLLATARTWLWSIVSPLLAFAKE